MSFDQKLDSTRPTRRSVTSSIDSGGTRTFEVIRQRQHESHASVVD